MIVFIQGLKYYWKLPANNKELIPSIAQKFNLSYPIAQTLIQRGYTCTQQVESFLFSSLAKDVAHASLLKDAQKAVHRIMKALAHQEKILIFGDYDVDGITSSSMMMLCLKPLGAHVNFFLPHRVRDGYGLSTQIVERAAQNNYKVIITVDNGITAFDAAQKAHEFGIDLIITDHHKPHDHIPLAYAIVNPHQKDCAYPFKYFAGVGVTFKVLSLLYETLGKALPDKAIELLLLGTVADVVPLIGENRFWVRHCLNYINNTESHAFHVLKKNGNIINKSALSSSDIGFAIAPQINALGRLEDPRQGVKFLIGSDTQEIDQVGSVLWHLNQTRKDIEKSILDEIVVSIEQKKIDLEQEHIIMAAHHQWPPGVIGLVASRLVGMYGKPTILLHINSQGKAKGSCRSIAAFNMFDALHSCKDLLDSFGGHAQAAGLSLSLEKVPELKNRLEQRIRDVVPAQDLQQTVDIDADLVLPEVNKKIMHDLNLLEPFGHQNAPPTFCVQDVTLLNEPVLLKNVHVKCTIFSQGIIKPIIFFNRPELYSWLKEKKDSSFHVATQIIENEWQGVRHIELRGIDVAEHI